MSSSRWRWTWPLVPLALAALVTVVVLLVPVVGDQSGPAEVGTLVVLLLWVAMPYAVVAGLVLISSRRSRTAWTLSTITSIALIGVGVWGLSGYVRSDDAQTPLLLVFGPLYELAAVAPIALAVIVLVVVAVNRANRAADTSRMSATNDLTPGARSARR